MKEAGAAYDRRVIIALANYIENRNDKPDWLAKSIQSSKAASSEALESKTE